MKSGILTLLLLIAGVTTSFAHYMWLETSASGTLNSAHEVKVRFGEYTYGVIEEVNGDAFQSVSDFKLWLVLPDGSKKGLDVQAKDNYYLATFVPSQEGVYTLALDNKNMKVLDYSQYDMGIMKPQYHAKAKVVVGQSFSPLESTNPEGIEIIDHSKSAYAVNGEVKLQILFQGKPLPENEVSIYMTDLWAKKLWTDENGMVSFTLPWDQLYTVEATYDENTPGSFNQHAYEYIWHCATYSLMPLKN